MKGALLGAYHGRETGPSGSEPGMLVVYDLQDPEVWRRVRGELKAWGRSFANVHRLDNDHVLILFRPGAARRFAE
jgi:hypothetical protein